MWLPVAVYIAVNAVVLTFGLVRVFAKCEIKKLNAFIPFFRYFRLAQLADMGDAGFVFMLAALAAVTVPFVFRDGRGVSAAGITFTAVYIEAALAFVLVIYNFRIMSGLCRLFNTNKLWIIPGAVLSCLPMAYWGFSEKVRPVYGLSQASSAPVYGIDAAASSEGLTVNIKSRTVLDGWKKKCLLRDIHMHIPAGRMVLLLGGSGAGKTTLVNAIIGYEKAKAKILLNGENVYRHYSRLKYEIGYVPQQNLIRDDDNVLRTLSDAAVLRLPASVSREERNLRVDEVLDTFGMMPMKNSEVDKLSGGQKKRLSIAMEYIADPYLFVLDEPDSGLDGVLARDLMTRLRDISRQGKIVIVITHSPDRVKDLFDDVIVLAKDSSRTGRLVYYGTVAEAESFFETDEMERIVKKINRVEEGGDGLADDLIRKYMEAGHAKL